MPNTPSYTLAELAALTDSTLIGDAEWRIRKVSDLEAATEEELSFLSNKRYASLLAQTRAGAILVDSPHALPQGKNYLINENPSLAFQKIINHLALRPKSGFEGIHPTAVLHESVKLGANVMIAPHAVLDQGVIIGDNTKIGAGCFIGPFSTIGNDCTLHPRCVIRENCQLGHRVTLQPGVVVGSCGFGYITNETGHHSRLEQLGNVIIEDDVEIGANTTIDRARFQSTRIGKGTKIDNLVQVGHNVQLGHHNLIVAQTGLAGSSKTGNYVVMGGQAALVGHITIADQTIIAARGAPAKSILEPGGKYAGAPAMPLHEYNRQQVQLRNIAKIIKRIEALENPS